MQLEWFHDFLETANSGSLSKASEKLSITQPALSKLIRNLERNLGVTLFHRSVTGVELTPAGRELKARMEPILADIHLLMNDLRSLQGTEPLKIGVVPSIATHYLPTKMASIYDAFPNAQLVVGNTSADVYPWIINGDTDVILAERRHPRLKHTWSKPLIEESFMCMVPMTSQFANAASVQLCDISQEALVVYPPVCDIRAAIIRNYEKQALTLKVALEVPFAESILAFVQAGAGITIVPETIATQADKYGLRAIPIVDFQEKRTIHLLARSESVGKQLYRRLTKGE